MNHTTRLFGLRGAVCAGNSEADIQSAVKELYEELFSINSIPEESIVSILFSVTDDLTVLNPATALRRAGYCSDVPLFCCAEPVIDGGMKGVIRVLITCYAETKPKSVYIRGAEKLRPDIISAPAN